MKIVYNFIGNDEKECLTTLITANAAGELAPPMVMFCYERVPANVTKRIPDNWGVGRSESGWMTGETFYEFVANVFLPWVKECQIELPIVLYVDGHRSHLTLALSNFCSQNGIILVALYPNSTHILQPMDVALFRTLKSSWKVEVRNWKIANDGKKITREFFCPILNKALQSVKKDTIMNGFRSCGLYPLNADAIKYEKYFKTNEMKKNMDSSFTTFTAPSDLTIAAHPDFLTYLENVIGAEKTESFQNVFNDQWQGAEEDKSLYNFWKKLKTDLIRNHKIPDLETNYSEQHSVMETVINDGDIILEGDWIDLLIDKSQDEFEPLLETNENKVQDTSNKNKINILSDIIIHQEPHKEMVDKATEQLNLGIENAENLVFKKIRFKENEVDKINFDEIIIDNQKENICPNGDDVNEKDIKENKKDIKKNEKDISTQLQPSPETVTNIPENIPSPFKSALFWPEIIKTNSKKLKEKIPTVVTSVKWKEYHQNKEEQKNRKIFELNERKRKRAEKAEEKALKSKKTTSNEQRLEPRINVTSENISYEKNSFVIVKYDEDYFPEQILNVTDKQVRVNVMLKSGRNGWKWPNTPDVLWYEKTDVMKEITEPKKLNNRGIYTVEEMKYYD